MAFRFRRGNSWTLVGQPLGGFFSGVWGSGSNDVWAVGSRNLVSEALHWDGTAWSPVPTTEQYESFFAAVWGSGPSDVWAVGFGAILRH
jgi:hypothetical protein